MFKMRFLFSQVLLLCSFVAVSAQTVPAPADFFGYELGQEFTPHHRVIDYYERVSEQSDRVSLVRYGKTNEGRPLVVAMVSSPENLARLETIRTDNLKRAGLLDGEPSGTETVIVWLSYNVHGNESVSTEAALATLYDLANPGNSTASSWLKDAVIVLDPCINPDGRERYVQWYKRTRGAKHNVNPDAAEHNEPWPGGRANHYLFDLNRDWAWATQVETKARLALYQEWMPQVHVDFHEQGVNSPYYFAPAAEPYHGVVTEWQREAQRLIGRNHARVFDQNNWFYFTREVFDLFYPGYGDTWPLYNGAIGMTYEQGGSGRAGLGIITAEGDTLTLRNRIDHHHATSLSTIEVAVREKTRFLNEFSSFFDSSRPSNSGYRSYVIKKTNAPGKLRALKKHLDTQGIAVSMVSDNRSVSGFNYRDNTTRTLAVEKGDWIVSVSQPRGVLADVLFEPNPVLVDSVTYDITAWSLPYVYDVDAYAFKQDLPSTDLQPLPVVTFDAGAFGYIARWTSFEDAQFLADLLKNKVRVRFTTRTIKTGGEEFAPGSLIIVRAGNQSVAAGFDTILAEVSAKYAAKLVPVASGLVEFGPDFGSNDVRYLKPPSILLALGEMASSYSGGELWHFFDQQLDYPVTVVEPEGLTRVDLDEYDVVILPSGSYGRVLNESGMEKLTGWVRSGGTLIALESAAGSFVGQSGFKIKKKEAAKDDDSKDDKGVEDTLRIFGDRERESQRGSIPGAIYRVSMDPSHPLAYGFGPESYTLRRSNTAYSFLEEEWNVSVIREAGLLSGFAGVDVIKNQQNVLVNGVQSLGRGNVVYLTDDPLFRGFWYSGRLLISNAIFMVGR